MLNFITAKDPYSTAYDRYGDPHKLVEFRMLVLNHCSMDCKGCFYKRTDNNFNDFKSSLALAKDMTANGYRLETCYLLPTDIFDNPDNYQLFENQDFADTLRGFAYVGVAATLETDYDSRLFDLVYALREDIRIELQVNLSIKRLFDINYQMIVRNNIFRIKQQYGDRVVINLAINTGFELTEREKDRLKKMLKELSEDAILELNFTFLYNNDISDEKKNKMLKQSISTVREFGEYYEKDESFTTKYNQRTFLRKPSFVFVGDPNRIYVNPIVPFDEYVYIKKERYLLKSASYDGFLNSYSEISGINTPVIEACENCENLTQCMGKFYFAIANEFELGCFLEIKE